MSQGVYVLGGKCPGGKCPGGKCPWVKCPGGTCLGWGGGVRNLVMIQHYGVLIPKEDMAA